MANGNITIDLRAITGPEVNALIDENKRLNSQIYNLQKIKSKQQRRINFLQREVKRLEKANDNIR